MTENTTSADGLTWRKASASTANGNCTELSKLPEGGVAIRDSKDSTGPVLRFTGDEFIAFLDGCKAGEFDDLV